jgi:hypothetical protein
MVLPAWVLYCMMENIMILLRDRSYEESVLAGFMVG